MIPWILVVVCMASNSSASATQVSVTPNLSKSACMEIADRLNKVTQLHIAAICVEDK